VPTGQVVAIVSALLATEGLAWARTLLCGVAPYVGEPPNGPPSPTSCRGKEAEDDRDFWRDQFNEVRAELREARVTPSTTQFPRAVEGANRDPDFHTPTRTRYPWRAMLRTVVAYIPGLPSCCPRSRRPPASSGGRGSPRIQPAPHSRVLDRLGTRRVPKLPAAAQSSAYLAQRVTSS
jgi:hypothetical protein